MNKKKKNYLKKPLTFSVFLIFLFILIGGKSYTAHKSNDLNPPFTEKTISSILSILGGNHLIYVLKKPDNNQGGDTADDENTKDNKKSESDPYGNSGNRTSKKKANSED